MVVLKNKIKRFGFLRHVSVKKIQFINFGFLKDISVKKFNI